MKKRNKFNLSNYSGFTCNMGNLIPVGIQEVLPGDTFQHSTNLMIRCAPDRKSTRLNSSHITRSRMPSSA